eukprot:5548088-Pleurochrysis_carterae.AAC.1
MTCRHSRSAEAVAPKSATGDERTARSAMTTMRIALNPMERCHVLHRNASRRVVGDARDGE